MLGLPGHASHTQSCAWCHCTVDTRDDASRYSAIDPPNARKTDADYDAACRACEIDVVLDHGTFLRVRALLEYDKRSDGARGRALTMDVGPHLLKGDRLEPTAALPDVSLFDTLTPPLYSKVLASQFRNARTTQVPLVFRGNRHISG